MADSKMIGELMVIPGVGRSIAHDLRNIGIKGIRDLKDQDPEHLYEMVNRFEGVRQDRCLLYVLRCAVYFASTPAEEHDPEKLKWWAWKDRK